MQGSKMERVSTNLTLFFKIFLPTFWIVFFGAFTLVVLFYEYEAIGTISARYFRTGAVVFYLSGILILYLTLMRLMRVEMAEDFVYVTNYFKTLRYPYHNIEKMEISRFFFFRTATLKLKVPGSFGKTITFIPSYYRLKGFLDDHPSIKRDLNPDV